MQGLLDQYITELKSKRQKLREKRKPNKSNSTQNGDNVDDDDFEAEDECEEDDYDDDYDFIEDKLLSQNNNINGQQERNVFQNLINGETVDKSLRKQRMWKKDILRHDDFGKMKDMVTRLRKHRVNEQAGAKDPSNTSKSKQVGARTSIQQTQGSNLLIKKENPNRRSYLNK